MTTAHLCRARFFTVKVFTCERFVPVSYRWSNFRSVEIFIFTRREKATTYLIKASSYHRAQLSNKKG
jgi:hypothetical protein